jgi:hypothetical protein
LTRIAFVGAIGQNRLRRVQGNGGIAARIRIAAERQRLNTRLIHDPLGAHAARDRAICANWGGQAHGHAVIPRQHIALPATPHHRIAAPHQKPVAGMRRMLQRIAMRRIVKKLHQAFIPTATLR